jgi:hypothetical protein
MSVNVINEGGTIDPKTASADDLASLFQAARERKIVVQPAGDLLTVTPTRTSVKALNRAKRLERMSAVKSAVLDVVSANRPTKIGPVVTKVAAVLPDVDRNTVLQALRELRDEGKLVSRNKTDSNFHMEWDLPSVEPQPATEATAESTSGDVTSEPTVTDDTSSSETSVSSTTSDDTEDLGTDAA